MAFLVTSLFTIQIINNFIVYQRIEKNKMDQFQIQKKSNLQTSYKDYHIKKVLREPNIVVEPKEILEIFVKLKPLKITLELDRFQEYKTKMNIFLKYMLLRYIRRHTKKAKKLVIWIGSSLYRSFYQLTIHSNNYFKFKFFQDEGQIHTLVE